MLDFMTQDAAPFYKTLYIKKKIPGLMGANQPQRNTCCVLKPVLKVFSDVLFL